MPRRADEPRPEVLKAAAEAAERQSLEARVRLRRHNVRWSLAFPFLVVALFALNALTPEGAAERPVLALLFGPAFLILIVLLLVSTIAVLSLILGKLFRLGAVLDLILGKLFRRPPSKHLRWGLAFAFSVVALFALITLTPEGVAQRPVLGPLFGLAVLILVVLFLASTVIVLPLILGKLFRSTGAVLDLILGKLFQRPSSKHLRWGLAFAFSVVALFALITLTPEGVAQRPVLGPLFGLAVLILVVLFLASTVIVLTLIFGKLFRRPPLKHPANAAGAPDPPCSPRLIALKRSRRWWCVPLCVCVVAALVNPATSGFLLLLLVKLLSLTVEIRRERRPLKLPVLNAITRPSPDGDRIKRKRLMWVRILAATIVVFFVVMLLVGVAGYSSRDSSTFGVFAFLFVIAVVTALGISAARIVKYGRIVRDDERRRLSKILEWQDVADSEFVLYLRSFADDVAAARRMEGGLTAEEHFARILNQVGPVVAVGSPGEDQPELGAYRLYLDHSVWQESVETLIGRAKLVVIRTGVSEGLSWEIERAVGRVLPQRLLIVVDDEQEMRRCLSCMRKIHPQVSASVRLGPRQTCGILGLLVFDDHWSVTALPMRGMGWYKHRSRNVVDPGLARSMYPVFQTLGVEWPPPRIAIVRSLVVGLALLMVSLFLLVESVRVVRSIMGLGPL